MSGSGSPQAGFLPARVIHLHPSRFCNLACQHCYSESGPDKRGELAVEAIISALAILQREGYEVLSLSGGEPLLYSGFEAVVRGAVALGFRVNLITNGAPVGGKLLDIIAEYVNLIAISLDGAPELHNELRQDKNAFARAERAIDRLAALNVQYGISYCVSRKSLPDMPWAVEFARAKGAVLVQFHPFAALGRGRHFNNYLSLTESEKARAYVIAALLDMDQNPVIQLDLAPVEASRLRRNDYAILTLNDACSIPLSDLVNPLIIDEMGHILPLCYGIAPHYMLGQIGPDLTLLIGRYKSKGWHDLGRLLNATFEGLGLHGENFVDWFYQIVEISYELHHNVELREAKICGQAL